ncbi:MAG TPA: alpha/beta hydrolase [Bryobacteraceae bacterium]|nr:alpha/beta hydrolase [Bryobacteraceae bacterium]
MKPRVNHRTVGLALVIASGLMAQERPDTSSHTVQFVSVETDVRLEVLDWGGSGRPLIFLAGMGNTAHIFDSFAPKFTGNCHVYGITRRGFGLSSKPEPTVANYSAGRLGDDVLAVIDGLKLNRPVVAGHSIAGEELSSVGSHHPEKVAGLIYLDAGYGYAFYDTMHGDLWLDMIDLRKRIDALEAGTAEDRKQNWNEMLGDATRLEKALQQVTKEMASMPNVPTPPAIGRAIQFGAEKYTKIPVPILAIFAVSRTPNPHAAEQVQAFEAGLPSARVVRLQHAEHYVFRSNEAEVVREMNSFLGSIK